MATDAQNKTPSIPTEDSSLPETKEYLEYLVDSEKSITIRDLIGFWGSRARGSRVVDLVNRELEEMGLRVAPPIDSGPLGTHVIVMRTEEATDDPGKIEPLDDHLLTISRIESTTYALQSSHNDATDEQTILSSFTRGTPIAEALTLMTRKDFSQVPIIDDVAHFHPIGAFTWESFAQSAIRGTSPEVVGEAMTPAPQADLSADLFSCIEQVSKNGFVLATHRGRLTGIVTPYDLIDELKRLTKPFLAIGRCERELRRVARGALGVQLENHKQSIEDMTFGNIQHFFKEHWTELGWRLSKNDFVGWLDDTRNLRNRIAHFESQDWDYSHEISSVDRLTQWLSSLQFDTDDESEGILDTEAPGVKDRNFS